MQVGRLQIRHGRDLTNSIQIITLVVGKKVDEESWRDRRESRSLAEFQREGKKTNGKIRSVQIVYNQHSCLDVDF